MKRYILIAAIFLAVASVAQAQMSRESGTVQRQTTINTESSKVMTVSAKPNGSSSVTTESRMGRKVQPPSNKYWKQNTPNAVYQRNFQSRANSRYNGALNRMRDAEWQKVKAEKALAELPEKQMLEKAKLQEKFEKAMPGGWENEQWLIDEMKKLEQKHAKQLAKAQEKVRKATQRYEDAVKKVRDTRMEIYRMAMVRYT